jgi:hypothetical protein
LMLCVAFFGCFCRARSWWAEPFHTSTLVIRAHATLNPTATHHVARPHMLFFFPLTPHTDMREHYLPCGSPPGTRPHDGRRGRRTSQGTYVGCGLVKGGGGSGWV